MGIENTLNLGDKTLAMFLLPATQSTTGETGCEEFLSFLTSDQNDDFISGE